MTVPRLLAARDVLFGQVSHLRTLASRQDRVATLLHKSRSVDELVGVHEELSDDFAAAHMATLWHGISKWVNVDKGIAVPRAGAAVMPLASLSLKDGPMSRSVIGEVVAHTLELVKVSGFLM